jgi:hypothetical protein
VVAVQGEEEGAGVGGEPSCISMMH